MARSRMYRHDVRCPHCGSNWCKKNGHANDKQTYLCNDCFHRFTPEAKRHTYPERVKQEAAKMYCEGAGIGAISRVLGVKLGTVYSWLKKAEWALTVVESRTEALKSSSAESIALDEMWTYAGVRKGPKRNSLWIWTAVVDGDKVVFEVGDRSEETLIRLCDRLPVAKSYHTDGYEVYGWLPRNQHQVSKFGKVNQNEGLHSRFRDRLRRLARKTKGYTKSVSMLRGSLALVCLYLGLI